MGDVTFSFLSLKYSHDLNNGPLVNRIISLSDIFVSANQMVGTIRITDINSIF